MSHEKHHNKLQKAERAEKRAEDLLAKESRSFEKLWDPEATEALRWRPGIDVRTINTAATPGFHGSAKDGLALIKAVQPELEDLQERLFAQGKKGAQKSVLLVIQGLDTSGKGGIVRHVVGLVDPQGVDYHTFGVPTAEEREHGYLWRIRKALPGPGKIGVFDRSQYEQVLIVRVEEQEPFEVWSQHYGEINDLEKELVAGGTRIIKVALIVSKDEQKRRLMRRLERPDKNWKYSKNDLPTRRQFSKYLDAYQDVMERTSTDHAPWFLIPADEKWFTQVATTQLLLETLRSMDLRWPPADYDIEEQKRLLAET